MSDPTEQTINIVHPGSPGRTYAIPASQLSAALEQGFTTESGEQASQRVGEAAAEASATSASGKLGALVTAVPAGMTFGGSDVLFRGAKEMRDRNPGISLAGNLIGGAVSGGLAGKVGSAASGLVRGEGAIAQIGRTALASTTEGALYGAGSGVSELALSDQPITAERIAQTMGSNILLGGATGGIIGGASGLVEKGLARAGSKLAETSAARAAIEGVPADLAHLDEAGLKAASITAKAEHAADATAERASLEQLRVEQRAELANQVRDLHTDLATERPIFKAITEADGSTLNPALKGIPGVQDAQVQLAKSFKSLRATLDKEITVARDPGRLVDALEMRQAALEKLQQAAPDIHAAIPGDKRLESLIHVNDALEQTKQQIATISQLSPKAPLVSDRLTMLEAGPSPRMQAIEAAREALKKAPELGMVGKGATAAAFAGGTALAHMIPGVGFAAPFVGKGVSEFVGSLFKRMAGANTEIAAKATAATRKFLGIAEKGVAKVAVVGPRVGAATALDTLRAVRYGASQGEETPRVLHLAFKARADELKQQTEYAPDGTVQMRPEMRMALAQKLDPVRTVNPVLADQLETIAVRRTAYVSSKLPRQPSIDGLQIGPDTWRPSDLAIRSFARTARAAEDPSSVEERLANGIVTPEEAEAYRTVYPERFADMQATIIRLAPMLSKTLSTKKKVALSVFTGVPVMAAMQPNILKVLQGSFEDEPGSEGGTQAPAPTPNFGALGSLKSADKPTQSQQRSES